MAELVTNPRVAALHSLVRCEADGKFANLEVNTSLKGTALSAPDRALYTALVYGVAERQLTLDHILRQLSDRELTDMDLQAKNAIRMGLYQMIYMDKIPMHAAVSESVEAVPRRLRGFVNAILRSYQRQKATLRYPLREEGFDTYLSIKESIPEEICRLWREGYGEERAEALAAAANDHTPLTLRINTLRTDAAAVQAALAARGVETDPHPVFSDMLVARGNAAIGLITDLLESGDFFVQDPASLACVKALRARPGERVLDVCAAPGGKSFSCAIEMKNEGSLLSCDLHKSKISLIERGAARLGISILRAECRDGKTFEPTFEGRFDRVLCDVPCSGLGVMAKKPDIRLRPLDYLDTLYRTQGDILENASRYVKEGGTLVYSTCTLNPEENERAVCRFLEKNPAFTPSDFSVGHLRAERGMLTLFPGGISTDGFFVAVMKRK